MFVRARLGSACRAAREGAGLLLLDMELATGLAQSQLSRFERGLIWPENIEDIVEGYEQVCGLPDGELWRRAVNQPEGEEP